MKPLIGITVFHETRELNKKYIALNNAYVEAIEMAGGIPILIPFADEALAKEYVDRCDGILFSGGEDVSPLFYGEDPKKQLGVIDTKRDFWEKALLKAVVEKSKPILGICRGCQVINVFLGGNLFQDIDSQVKNVLGHHPKGVLGDEKYHRIKIKKDSELYKIFNREIIEINSFHHQSVKELGEDLKVIATANDGIVEAFQSYDMDEHYILGIQWHPEAMVKRYDEFLKIFENFVEKCSK
ncbi:MAG: gamma-glutamyl-gamma-aminobutyrate hydrolase family protein [Fusobacteriaceae bacterium]